MSGSHFTHSGIIKLYYKHRKTTPFVIYADFKCLIQREYIPAGSSMLSDLHYHVHLILAIIE